jgi:succinate dehydrogenase/fumarate reductase-like Fe-S protein
MSLDKAIKHGKEKRKEYRGSASFSQSCRDNTCPYCAARLKYKAERRKPIMEQQRHGAQGE